MEKWNEICVDLCNCQNRNVSESEYQKQVALDLRLLGWKLYAHEIREQMTIEIGAANALRPDFVIYKDEKPQFVIELKRPQHVQRERERTQLFSYMKQLNLKSAFILERIFRFSILTLQRMKTHGWFSAWH